MKNRDNRKDISNLNMPIIKAIQWYIVDSEERVELNDENIDDIRRITQYAIRGLEKLQNDTYHEDLTIKIILQYFINLLRSALNDEYDNVSVIKSELEHDKNILSDKIKNNFDPNILTSIAKNFDDAEASSNDLNAYIECVHKLLINRDMTFTKMMKEVNTIL